MIEALLLKPIPTEKLEDLSHEFLEYKRATGLKYRSEERYLKYFTRHCNEVYPDGYIPEDAAYHWLNISENRAQKTKANMAHTMKEFGKYLFSLGYTALRIPEIRAPKTTAFTPHIFTEEEMNAIWNTVDHIEPDHWYPNMHRCIPVLFRLLYSCGLRISEALAITASDIDFDKNVIKLRHTKTGMERLIPMGDYIAKIMK
ncbi:MAG: tyrosine-type recombinase/integrase [Lachnospiraceae bacterium]|nr:tyrosine-type recombinase/integrase [Lachnospiraceae bacterium]